MAACNTIHNLQAVLFSQRYRSNGIISVPSLDDLHNKLAQQERRFSQSAWSLLLAYERQFSSSSSAQMISENNYEMVIPLVDSKSTHEFD